MSTKSDILTASAQVLTRAGSLNYSVRQVANSAGVRVGHLQYYFPSKALLLQATVEEICKQAHFRLSCPLRLGKAPIEQAKAIIARIFENLDTPTGSVAVWEVWALAGHNAEIADSLANFYGSLRKVLTQLIARARPQLCPDRRGALACCIVALVEGSGVLVAYSRREEAALHNLRSEIFRLVEHIFTEEEPS